MSVKEVVSNKNRILLCLLCFVLTCGIQAQKKENSKKLQKAEEAIYNRNFKDAIQIYQELIETMPEDKDYLSFRQGLCYVYSNIDPEKGYELIESASGLTETDLASSYYYHLGRAYHSAGKFDKAISSYNSALENIDKKDDKLKEELNYQLGIAENAKIFTTQGAERHIRIHSAGELVNSKYSDYKPVISADESVLIFTSRRKETTGGEMDEDGQYFEDIYVSNRDESGFWQKPIAIPGNINTNDHEASVGLSTDGSQLFIYKGDENSGDIFYSLKQGDIWNTPALLGEKNIINSKFSETSASITADGNKIYFTSDRKDSKGGLDIYVSEKKSDGTWGKPSHLGDVINTKYDEESPFIHPDGKTLYFSSKGHNSMGGFDVFKSTYDGSNWSKPENLGYPVNSTADDVHFVLSANGRRAYLSSARIGTNGNEDIFKVRMNESVEPMILVKGKVIVEDNTPVSINMFDMEDFSEQRYVYDPDPQTGEYLMVLPQGKKYSMFVEAEGYKPYMVEVEIPNFDEYHEIYQEIILNKVNMVDNPVGEEIVVVNSFENFRDKKGEYNPELQLPNPSYLEDLVDDIISETDEGGTDSESVKKLLAQTNKATNDVTNRFGDVKKENHYTDASGASTSLEKLQNFEMVPYVIDNDTIYAIPFDDLAMNIDPEGYPTESITARDIKGVLAGNDTSYMIAPTMLHIAKLSGYKIEESVNENGDTLYALEKKYVEDHKIKDELAYVEKEEYNSMLASGTLAENTQETEETEEIEEVEENEETEETEEVEESEVEETEEVVDASKYLKKKTVYFGFDKSTVSTTFHPGLDSIVTTLNTFKTAKVEVEGHTDSKGPSNYNKILGEKRSKSTVNYLVNKGISKSRISTKSYGEDRPAFPNTKPDGSDNPTGRKLNRRTVVKVLD